jgi:hypothetical protein
MGKASTFTAKVETPRASTMWLIDKWRQLLGSGATTHVVPVEPFDGDTIPFEGSHIEVLNSPWCKSGVASRAAMRPPGKARRPRISGIFEGGGTQPGGMQCRPNAGGLASRAVKHIQGDTNENTMLWIPGERILVGGDVVFNNMHVYTAETDSQARRKWFDSLNTIRELKPSVVVPGHSKAGALLDASTAVEFTKTYLFAFEEELFKAKNPDSLIRAMKERFPSAGLFLAIERGAAANVKP